MLLVLLPLPRVVAKSAQLRFRLTMKTAFAPLLLLSNANPLRWALRWGAACGRPNLLEVLLKARLWGVWGSSLALGIGGRMIAAPTKWGEFFRPFVGADDLGGPRAAQVAAPTAIPRPFGPTPFKRGPGGAWPSPTVLTGLRWKSRPFPSSVWPSASPPTPFGLRPFPYPLCLAMLDISP